MPMLPSTSLPCTPSVIVSPVRLVLCRRKASGFMPLAAATSSMCFSRVGYRIIEASINELLVAPGYRASWC